MKGTAKAVPFYMGKRYNRNRENKGMKI